LLQHGALKREKRGAFAPDLLVTIFATQRGKFFATTLCVGREDDARA
jgi:hypothetical protein